MNNKKSTLSLFSLIMLITVSIDSIRNLPIAALFGAKMILFFVIAGVSFLIPTGFIAAELTASHTEQGGIYGWVKAAFGKKTGFLAIWLQWINTLVWYPTTLAFIAGSIAFTISPSLSQNKWVIMGIIVAIFWLLTLVNLRGFSTSTRFASVCAIFGMLIPMVVLIGLALVWICLGNHSQIHFNTHTLFPNLGVSSHWISMVAIVTSFLGMELASVHVHSVPSPSRTFPKAILISAFAILITMLAGSLAIAMIIPTNQINLVDGVMTEFQYLLNYFHLSWCLPLMAVLIILGGIGSMINWMISPAMGILQATEDHYLPHYLSKKNQHGVAHRILILQAIIVSIASGAFWLMPGVNASYWLLTDLSTELYVGMYTLMFLAALVLYFKTGKISKLLKNIGGKWMLFLLCALGLMGCIITLIVGFIPPDNIKTGGDSHYQWIFISGLILMISPCLLGYRHHNRQHKKTLSKAE